MLVSSNNFIKVFDGFSDYSVNEGNNYGKASGSHDRITYCFSRLISFSESGAIKHLVSRVCITASILANLVICTTRLDENDIGDQTFVLLVFHDGFVVFALMVITFSDYIFISNYFFMKHHFMVNYLKSILVLKS